MFCSLYLCERAVMKKNKIIELIKSKSGVYLIMLGTGLGLTVGMTLNLLYILDASMLTDYANQFSDTTEYSSFLWKVFFICLAGPVIEEMLYRGVLYRVVKRFLPYLWANLIQAVIFAISHYNPIQTFYTFNLGLILGYTYSKYQTIAAPILIHISFNVMGFLLPELLTVYVLSRVQNIGILFSIVFSLLCIGIFLFCRAFLKIKQFRVRLIEYV